MDLSLDDILKEVLQNKRVSELVSKNNLTKEQMIDALPILIDMSKEKDDDSTNTLTSLYVSEQGHVKRSWVLSSKGKRISYIENVITQSINYIDFEDGEVFHKDDNRKELVNLFSKYISDDENIKKGLYIYGKMGIGKTFILKRFVKMIAQKGKKVGFVNLSNLVSTVKSTFGGGSSTDTLLTMLKEVEYLFIDDIGAEKISSWFRDDFLFTLLNERMDRNRKTFFSSNYSTTQLINQESKTSGAKYKDHENSMRLVSRIRALSIEVQLDGENKRY